MKVFRGLRSATLTKLFEFSYDDKDDVEEEVFDL